MSEKSHEPHVPASKTLPEITFVTVALAIVLSVVLAAANAYLGMFAGLTVSASIPAAVISMALLKVIGGNILQNNAVQTAASAGESLAAGAIFTLPALVMLGFWTGFNYIETTILIALGGILGVMFTVPLRRALIVEEPLQFPEGVATAEVLKVGEAGGAGIRYILMGGAIGALFKLIVSGFNASKSAAHISFFGGKSAFSVGTDLSPALVAVGYIVGLNIAILVFLGGALNFLVAIPIFTAANPELYPDLGAADLAGTVWSQHTRYLGVGAMVVGGVWALIRLFPSLIKGIKSSIAAYRKAKNNTGEVIRTEKDMAMPIVLGVCVFSLIPLFGIFYHFTSSIGISAFMAAFVLVAGFLFSAVAAYMAGLVGSSNNPISGVTIATILAVALLLKLFGIDSELGPAAAILVGAVVCCAAAIGGDNMQDLKAGHIVGSTPSKQQIMQVIGVLAAAVAMAPILDLLNNAYTIGSPELPAPQAKLMQGVVDGLFGKGLPWTIVAIGAGIAVAVIIVDLILESRGSKFRTPVLAFAVGIYLPFELSVPIFIGGMIAHVAKRHFVKTGADESTVNTGMRNGMLLAAGLITGEALLGILLAVPIAISQDKKVLWLFENASAIPGLVLLGGVITLIYLSATGKSKEA